MTAIAIDGPAGAGKSTIARAMAKRLGYIYVDTGALYRAIGLYAHRRDALEGSDTRIAELLPGVGVELRFVSGEQRVILNGEDVSDAIRLPEISMAASRVSAIPDVRAFLFDLQRDMAKENNVVMDGRDIGTVVLPDAQVKIFLTATPEERARRRWLEMKQRGTEVDYDGLLAEVKQRDYNDSHRDISPLKQADDAVLIDTTGLEFEQSVELLMKTVEAKLKNVL